jgi:hypothetical protein
VKRVLRSLEKYNEMALLDSESGEISFYAKADQIEIAFKLPNGVFSSFDGKIISLYRIGDKLIFLTEATVIEFQDQDKVSIESVDNEHNRFKILRGEKVLFSWIYRRPKIEPSISASQMINPWIEEEDFDICLLIYNVVMNKNRAQRIFCN